MGKITEFISYLESHIGDAYVWGAQCQRIDTMPDVSAWVRKREKGNLIQSARCMRYIQASKKRPLYAFDCSGLIVYWLLNIKGLIKGDATANGLYAQCSKQGKIGAWTLAPGDFVFRRKDSEMKHVGVYVGNGYTIEAKGRDAGVVKLPLDKGTWTHQGRHSALAEDNPTSFQSSVKAGDVVKILSGATYYSGRAIPGWVKNKKWIVREVSGDRVVIDKSEDGRNAICSPINTQYLSVVSAAPEPSETAWTPKVGDIVNFTGNTHYSSSNSDRAVSCKPGKAKITQACNGKHPYHLVRISGGGATVYGWVDAGTFTKV